MTARHDVVVIGGGQAGLAMGHCLAQLGLDFVILDAAARTGDSWRNRWDSLTLFTAARYSALPGLRFPAPPDHHPHKDEVVDYLEAYARRFALPIRFGEKVIKLEYLSEWRGFAIETTLGRFEADQVVVATGAYHRPVVPEFARALDDRVLQLHTSTYKSVNDLQDGNVLVVGAGNSGVQIATEVAAAHPTWHSVGKRLPTLPYRFLNRDIFWWLSGSGFMGVSAETIAGRFARKREFLIGKSTEAGAAEHGIRLVGRARDAKGTIIGTVDGEALDVANVIWATGFQQDFSWIDAPVFDAGRRVIHRRGITAVGGLYFLGLPWLHTRGSSLIGWVGHDAKHIADHMR